MSTIHLTAIAANLKFLMGMSTVRLSVKTEHNKALPTPEGKTSRLHCLFGPKAKLVIVGTVKRQTKMALVSFILLLFSMEVYSYENYCFFNGVWWFLQERYRAVAG